VNRICEIVILTGREGSDSQEDDQEKSAQIPLMREIYSMAEEVIIWVGKSTADWKPSDENG
jgi:hypothetical protein